MESDIYLNGLVSVEEAPVRLEEIEFGASELKLNKLA
jgi:hypothetical protein